MFYFHFSCFLRSYALWPTLVEVANGLWTANVEPAVGLIPKRPGAQFVCSPISIGFSLYTPCLSVYTDKLVTWMKCNCTLVPMSPYRTEKEVSKLNVRQQVSSKSLAVWKAQNYCFKKVRDFNDTRITETIIPLFFLGCRCFFFGSKRKFW